MISKKQSERSRHQIARLLAVLFVAILVSGTGCRISPDGHPGTPATDIGLTTPVMVRTGEAPLFLPKTEPLDEQKAASFSELLDAPLEHYDALRPGGSMDLDTLLRVEIERVVDGDTFVVFRGRKSIKMRLIGVDAPESYAHHDEDSRTHEGESVSRIVKAWLEGRIIYLQFDQTDTDQYGRLLAYAWLDAHTMINEVLVREGLAEEQRYEPTTRYNDYFHLLEEKAQKEKRGIWSQP